MRVLILLFLMFRGDGVGRSGGVGWGVEGVRGGALRGRGVALCGL